MFITRCFFIDDLDFYLFVEVNRNVKTNSKGRRARAILRDDASTLYDSARRLRLRFRATDAQGGASEQTATLVPLLDTWERYDRRDHRVE